MKVMALSELETFRVTISTKKVLIAVTSLVPIDYRNGVHCEGLYGLAFAYHTEYWKTLFVCLNFNCLYFQCYYSITSIMIRKGGCMLAFRREPSRVTSH